ncbi:DUF3352 domain-containing protein [Bacteroidota bacterium]
MNRRLISTILIILFFAAVISISSYLYFRIKTTSTNPFFAIPESALVIAEFNNFNKTWDNFYSTCDIEKELEQIESFKLMSWEINRIDSIVNNYPDLADYLKLNKLYISLHLSRQNVPVPLFIMGLPNSTSISTIKEIITVLTGESRFFESEHLGTTIYGSDEKEPFYFTLLNGVFIYSKEFTVLEESLVQLNTNKPIQNESLTKVKSTAGKNVNANLYINQSKLKDLLGIFANIKYDSQLEYLSPFASWTEIDLIIKNDEILLNGYTAANDSSLNLINIFKNQTPQKLEVSRILPYNTNLLFVYGLEYFSLFHDNLYKNLKSHNQVADYEEKRQNLLKQFGHDIVLLMSPWIGNEVALAVTASLPQQIHNNSFCIIKAGNRELAANSLRRISDRSYNQQIKDFTVKRINAKGIIPLLFGSVFDNIQNAYYFNIDNYYIFANNPSALENYISSFYSGKTLRSNVNYKNFADNISESSNLLFYCNILNSFPIIESIVSPEIKEFITKNSSQIRNFEGIALQFSYLNKMYYTNLYIKHNPEYIQEDFSIWKVSLENDIAGKPYFVRDHRTNTLKIIVFDIENQMYLLDHNGKILWKRQLDEEVMSDVFLIDFYKNGKIQYLFNTKNYIYLIDLLGRDVEDYPVRLPRKATNGLAVFDYDKDMDYRILIALEDNKIYNFKKTGMPVKGWIKPLANNTVTEAVQFIRANDRDYVLFTDISGNVKIYDRRGKPRIVLKSDLTKGRNSIFYENQTNSSKGIIISTDDEGKLVYIKKNGEVTRTKFGDYSKDHYFLYEDFDKKGGKDFIFLDDNKLVVFDRFKNIIMEHDFKHEMGSSPVIIPVSPTDNIIGVVSGNSNKIYLFDNQGNLLSTPDMLGQTQILVGSLLNDGQLNLIAGSGNTLYNYHFR